MTEKTVQHLDVRRIGGGGGGQSVEEFTSSTLVLIFGDAVLYIYVVGLHTL